MADPAEMNPPPFQTGEDSTSESSWSQRFARKRLVLGGGVLVVLAALGGAAAWNWLNGSAQSTGPELENSAEKELARQIESILAGQSTQLYLSDLPIQDQTLSLLPIDELQEKSEKAAQRAAQVEQRRQEKQLLELSNDAENEDVRHPVASKSEQANLGSPSGDDDSEPIARLDTVLIDQGIVTDDGLALLSRLPDLEHLRLRLSPITDEGVRSLRACEKLWLLNLPHSRLTIQGVRSLRDLPRLKQLRLGSPALNNECCRAIAEIKSLRGLHLIGIPVTDEGLQVLATLPHLESLYLDDSAVTDAGWKWLFETQPQLHVHVNQQHHDRDPHAHEH